ncbi:MAG: hypothetical protein ABII64_00845 [Elusimicrobiota bacterium]
MKKILSIAYYTFVENIRNKVFYVLVLFGMIIIAASLLLAALGGQQVQRILLDLGLGAIEFFALLTVAYSSVTLVIEEMESKTIYLVLTRPVSKMTYLLGRYFGLLAAVYCGIALMSTLHLGILFLNGWQFTLRYPLALLLSAGKITVMGSLAVFFAVFSTSAISSMSFTLFFWILGHFSEELMFLSGKMKGLFLKVIFKIAYFAAPNLQFFNLRDFWDVPGIAGPWIYASFFYAAVYSMFCLILTLILFSRKEF